MSRRLSILITIAVMLAMNAPAEHVLLDGTLQQSSIYPGTVHTFQVYVPEQYDASRPAALYVGLDGVLCNAPQVMDSLIAAGKMPCTIGVFLQPGVIKGDDGTVMRYNRCYEFDNTTQDFARFLESELLPAVEKMKTPHGRPILLSKQANDCMIFGLSSGGIAAFNAAWQRPDLFGKVFTGVGTFVAMRGGNEMQALVRKTEPLPLRVFIQDGSNDAWNPLFGHWYEGNQILASALQFAGYDVQCDWSDGSHNVKRATQIFARVMAWMWRDWPAVPALGKTQNDFLTGLLADGDTGWRKIDDIARQPSREESAIAVYPDSSHMAWEGELGENAVWQTMMREGQLCYSEPFYWLHNDDHSRPIDVQAMEFDGDGNLWVVTRMGIQICDQNGRVRALLRLPHNIERIQDIEIGNGLVTLYSPLGTWQRHLNVKAPVKGVRPQSQGQG